MLILARLKKEARAKAKKKNHILGYFYSDDEINNQYYNGQKVWFKAQCINCNMSIRISDKLNCHDDTVINPCCAPLEISAKHSSFYENALAVNAGRSAPFGIRAGGVINVPNLWCCESKKVEP